jgi:hypothetical protein
MKVIVPAALLRLHRAGLTSDAVVVEFDAGLVEPDVEPPEGEFELPPQAATKPAARTTTATTTGHLNSILRVTT